MPDQDAPITTVAVLDDYQDCARSYGPWERLGERIELHTFTDHLAEEDAVAERLSPFEVLVAMRERTPFPRSLLARLPRLKLLVTTGLANAAIDLEGAREHGIVVSGTTSGATSTAELTWALILGLTRRIHVEDAAIRAGDWQRTVGPELIGRTLGLIGLGRLGARVAGYAHAFDMNVLAWSQNLDAEHAATLGVEATSRDELLRRSDVVSIHLRLSERTVGLVGARELALMSPRAYLVNTSRGPIVDEAALVDALRRGVIAGAALDVFDQEPLPAEHALRSAPNTLLTPHIGYVTDENYRIFYEQAVEDIEAWLDGQPTRVL